MRNVIEAYFTRTDFGSGHGVPNKEARYRLVKLVNAITLPPYQSDISATGVRVQEVVSEAYVRSFVDVKGYKIVVQ